MNPRPLNINREPLVDIERGTSGYVLDLNILDSMTSAGALLGGSAEDIIQNPTVILGNLNRENYHDAICYSGRPGGYRNARGAYALPATGFVLLFFALRYEPTNSIVVFWWELRVEDPEKSGYPLNYESDFWRTSMALNSLVDEIREHTGNHRFAPLAPRYSDIGDFVSIFFKDELSYGNRIDDLLTIYRSVESGELIGCKLKGISILAKNVASLFGVVDGKIEFRLLLLNALGQSAKAEFYYDLGKIAGGVAIPAAQILEPVAG